MKTNTINKMTQKKSYLENAEDMKYKVIKSDCTTILAKIKIETSRDIDRKLIDLHEIGVVITKSEYISRCIEAGHKHLTFK